MKPTKTLFALVLAACLVSASLAAQEAPPALIKVPKTEAAIQATKATTAQYAAENQVKPAAHKTKSKQVKPSAHQSKAGQTKGTAAKKHKTKAPRQARAAK